MEKLQITEHFNSIINEIDLATETRIEQNQRLEDFYNERRQKQIDVVREIEKSKLLRLETGKAVEGHDESTKERFCFVMEFADIWFLATVNREVSQEEKDLFKVLLRWPNASYPERLDMLINDENDDSASEDPFYYYDDIDMIDIETSDFDLSEFRSTNSAVVDVSWWFDREFHVEEMTINLIECFHHKKFFLKPINSLLTIKTLRILLKLTFLSSEEYIKDMIDMVDRAAKCFGKVDNVVVEIHYELLNDLNISGFVESLRSNCSHEKLTISVATEVFAQTFPKESSSINYLKRIELIEPDLDWFSTVNWSSLKELIFDTVSFKGLESTDFSSLRSLKRLEILNSKHHQASANLTFLNPVRKSLEELKLSANRIKCLSWKMFRGMHQLKKLMIQENPIAKLELDGQRQLFADMHNLKDLHLDLNAAIMSTEWTLALPGLEILRLCPVLENDDQVSMDKFSINFKLPKLDCLSLDLNYSEDSDISFLAKSFNSVQELQLYLPDQYCMENGYFKEFKSLKKLSMFNNVHKEIADHTFDKLARLFNPMVGFEPKPGSLSGLEKLETIKIAVLKPSKIDLESLVDGLVSLREINIEKTQIERVSCESSESFVYYEKLNKLVLETRLLGDEESSDDDESYDDWSDEDSEEESLDEGISDEE